RTQTAARDQSIVQDQPEPRLNFLKLLQPGQSTGHVLGAFLIVMPISEKPVAEVFVNFSMVFLDDLLAGGNPAADERGQLVAHHAPAEWREILDVSDEEPDGNGRGLADGLLCKGGAQLARDFFWLPERERRVAYGDLVHIAKPNRLMDAAFVQKSSVAAAEIDEPELADVLQID